MMPLKMPRNGRISFESQSMAGYFRRKQMAAIVYILFDHNGMGKILIVHLCENKKTRNDYGESTITEEEKCKEEEFKSKKCNSLFE